MGGVAVLGVNLYRGSKVNGVGIRREEEGGRKCWSGENK